MKKRHIAAPILILGVIGAWQFTLQYHTPTVTAEDMQSYLHPVVKDPRHPIDVFQVTPVQGSTEGDVLSKLPTTVNPEDKVQFLIDPGFGVGTIVHITRAIPITVTDGKKVITLRTWADTVGEVLSDVHRPLVDLDTANVDVKEPLTANMNIIITRVEKIKIKTTEVIPFETTTKDDPNLYRHETKVTQEGSNGERTKTFEITRKDGDEVSRALVKNEVTKKPKTKTVTNGTKLKIGATHQGKATWYDLCCKKVASNVFKKGTVLRLTNKSNGKQIEVTVDDTGAFGPEVVVDLNPDLFKKLGASSGQGVIGNVLAEEILNP